MNTGDTCTGIDCLLQERRSKGSTCMNRTVRLSLVFGLVCLMAFIAGFILEPSRLRIIWLITTGTCTVLSGILAHLSCSVPEQD